ncbi:MULTISPECIES: tRNA (adenosine(37)-N6)-threonylcarbamoyltransferase complex dimerization subunit type 1 TsaB [unclassified Corynebacterium]|uniref:tRNA (adenosine(37)-N6)-threonylcarbamoyltransferase complex dimerization subunit type 1 TsaB n=1 Tax=unclassified Corynebacterium TaxID=2624378 RepID=UPI0034CE2EA3
MRVLCIDTSTTDLVTGLVDIDPAQPGNAAGAQPSAVPDATVEDTRAHNELLMPTIDQLLGGDYSQLDAVVAGCGPGPFTGLRVGMATASALAQARGIPVYGLCSHDAIAVAAAAQGGGEFVVATDARRKEIYYSVYRGTERVSGPDVARPEDVDFPDTVTAIFIPAALGERLPEKWHAAVHPALNPRPGALAAAVDFSAQPVPLVPLYLRRPDAKEPAPKPRSAAIPEVEL